jgi:hypothetical protein
LLPGHLTEKALLGFAFSFVLSIHKFDSYLGTSIITMNALRRASLPKPEEAGKAWPAIAIGMFVAFGGILYGYVPYFQAHQQKDVTNRRHP